MASPAQPYLLIAVLCGMGITLFLLTSTSSPAFLTKEAATGRATVQPVEVVVYTKLFSPKLEVLNGTEYVYQIPEKPKAVLFLAHGCSCKATFFWDKHPECRTCTGAPEERALVIKALRNSFAVIAVSSSGECWSQKRDSLRTKYVLESWIDEHSLVDLPILGLGASSGGYFLSTFARIFKFDAIVLMIAEGRFQSIPDASYPPVLFVHMPKDEVRAERIAHIMPVLRKAGIQVDEIQCKEVKITDKFFAKRIPYIDTESSGKLREAFVRSGFVDRKGSMKMDGRVANFESSLKDEASQELLYSLTSTGEKWEHHIREELNLAYAYHEFTSVPAGKIIAWFQARVNMPLNSTLESIVVR